MWLIPRQARCAYTPLFPSVHRPGDNSRLAAPLLRATSPPYATQCPQLPRNPLKPW